MEPPDGWLLPAYAMTSRRFRFSGLSWNKSQFPSQISAAPRQVLPLPALRHIIQFAYSFAVLYPPAKLDCVRNRIKLSSLKQPHTLGLLIAEFQPGKDLRLTRPELRSGAAATAIGSNSAKPFR